MNGQGEATEQRILVVEDSAATRRLLGLILEGAGYGVDLVESGADALEAAKQRAYDLVLMDLGLPEMDGYAASAALRNLASCGRSIPVVALTARTGINEIDRCRNAGLDGYMTKPFSPPKLVDEIRRWTTFTPGSATETGSTSVWDRPTYREVADRLGPARTEKALDMFEQHLVRSLDTLRTTPEEAEVVARETHALVGIAGLLGFRELFETSRRIMMRNGSEPCLDDLFDAADRALACVRRAPHSALV